MSSVNKVTLRDLPTRLFHWLQVACFGGLWYSGTHSEMVWHVRCGYLMAGLLLFRLGWGLVGGQHSRFTSLNLSPGKALDRWRQSNGDDALRHTLAGSWSIVIMLSALSFQVVTGLLANDSIFTEGPLAQFVSFETSNTATAWHSWSFNLLLALVALHIAAVLVHTVLLRHDIVPGIITGQRRVAATVPPPASGSGEHLVVLLMLIVMLLSWLSDLN